jgi:hypothetical protein
MGIIFNNSAIYWHLDSDFTKRKKINKKIQEIRRTCHTTDWW